MGLQKINTIMSNVPQEISIILRWKYIVGEHISKVSIPSTIKNSILTIYTKNSAWSYELGFHKKTIIDKVNLFLNDPIKSVKILASPYIQDNNRGKNSSKRLETQDLPPIDKKNSLLVASTLYIKNPELKKLAENIIWKSICKNKLN